MKHIIFTYIILVGSLASRAMAQEVVPITKLEVIAKVMTNNTAIKISEETYNVAKADYRQTNAIFLPSITASHTGIATTNPLMAFGSKLNQELLTPNDFNPALLNDPSQIQNFATKIEVQQPLINIDGVYQRKAARSKMEAMSFQNKRTTEYLEFEAEKAYMQLQLAHKGVDVIEKALQVAFENKRLANNQYEQGYIQRSDVLNVEVRVTEIQNQLQTAESNVLNASNYLSYLMNEDDSKVYIPVDTLATNVLNTFATNVPESRSDIMAMQLVSKAYEAVNKSDRMAFLPRLNAFGSYELYDNEVFQANANGYLFGAQLSWDIFQGSKRFGKAQKSKAEYEKSKLEYQQYVSKSNLELNKAKRMFVDAQNKLILTTLAMQQSAEALRIRTNRFKEGLEKTTDLLLVETQYAQKQLEYYQTIFEYNFAQAYVTFLTEE
ncbi:Outer membrane protein TolC [Formosa sp. Hel1_31_208]|uniref:TolC family protein n=1 Tax=Formosa sp. Hel1_31_208 TaxID=1798225 RepID=UPI00087CD9F2|nr:TolC family protein [Formosa sp. Hel1_31_208]SDS24852.1 Outer membrane protein TolC [Formosa sp. Hel1_31_208]